MNFLKSNAPLFNLFQRILDIVIVLIVSWLLSEIYGQAALMRVLAIYGSVLLVIIFSLFNVYRSWRGMSLVNQLKNLVLAWITVLIVFNILILLLSNKEQLEKLWPFVLFEAEASTVWTLVVFVGMAAIRVGTKLMLIYFRKRGYNQRSAYIVGAGDAGRELAKYLNDNPGMGIHVRGFFDDDFPGGKKITRSGAVLGELLGPTDACNESAFMNKVDMVFIALPMHAEEKINRLVWTLGTHGVKVFLVPDLFTMGIQRANVFQLGELNLMDFTLFPWWKRPFDIVFSLFVIILTSPIWLIIILLIKKEDNGPIFYRHPRVMESGKRFHCLKFRTMFVDADERLKDILLDSLKLRMEWEKSYKIKNDPRITKVGKFLRKTSLDEVPQFLNVIKGDMSVVGARPVVPEELDKYYKKTALTYCSTKPGVTGPWQIGKRSDTENYDERVKLDQWYVLNCSLWLDLKIILKTVWRVFRPQGAY